MEQKPETAAEVVEAAFTDFFKWRDAHEEDECQDLLCMSERYARDCAEGGE